MTRPGWKVALRRWMGPAALGLAVLPALGVALQAAADDAVPAEESPAEARKRVLAAMARDATVLINVTAREMPASPDILGLGKRGTLALARCLADNVDGDIRRSCALMLGSLGDRRGLPALQAALEDWEPAVRAQVISALTRMPDASSYEPLLRLFRRADESADNRAAILEALGALSLPKAVTVLRQELRRAPTKDGTDLRASAFEALWMSRHLMARATLEGEVAAALASDNTALQLAAAEAAASLRGKRLVAPLTPLLEHPDADIRNKAVYALGLIGDRSAAQVLLSRLPTVRESRMLNNIAFALERLDPGAFYASVRQVIEHKQAVIRLNAAFVLGDVKRPEGLPLLEKALGDPSDFVRTSAIVALGKLGTDAARKPLERFVSDPNLSIRQEAIYALHALSGGKRADLIHDKLFTTRNSSVRHRAAVALGKAGDARVRDYLLTCLEQQRCSVDEVAPYVRVDRSPQVAGRMLLLWAKGQDALTDLVAELRPTGTLPIALSTVDAAFAVGGRYDAIPALDLVGDLGDASARPRLAPRLGEQDTWLRLHALVALSRLGDRDADARLLTDLDNYPASWLSSVVEVMSRIKEPEVKARLTPELQRRARGAAASSGAAGGGASGGGTSGGGGSAASSAAPDLEVALAAAAVLLAWDPETAIFRFLEALASPSARERELAEEYLQDNRDQKVTWVLRRALSREKREDVRDRLRELLVGRD
ncbi:HEAT repeat domain-containing protein [Chondromyces apiculatus]|uniref:HEAT repeat protein n=1 Tax=Chondromyces apiculatus DSM 436 TaxID=1192034 RepID=A0A017T7F8_9BACT|nr:HEAT repeat domain-containing protein [Chondromyces apiculatus]EYF04740.1 Hypothetical protein CAP_4216 [Chondromyces apiculatus DSM 436]